MPYFLSKKWGPLQIKIIFKKRISELIENVVFKKNFALYDEADMKNFLVVAMISKNGIHNEFKEPFLARSLFKIVHHNTSSEAFRTISHKARLSCIEKDNKLHRRRSKSI